MQYKAFLLPAIGLLLLAIGYITFGGLEENLVYYLTPAEALEQRAEFPDGERFRLGGLVAEESIVISSDRVDFAITESGSTVEVVHFGEPPELFREGVGVVLEGTWANDRFEADTLILKHDEEYRSIEGDEPYVPPGQGG